MESPQNLSPLQAEVLSDFRAAVAVGLPSGSIAIADRLGKSKSGVKSALKRLRKMGLVPPRKPGDKTPLDGPGFVAPELPDKERSVEELIAHRKSEFERNRDWADSRKLIPIKINIPGPICIAHFGDPHIDNPGTDIAAIERDINIVKNTEGMFAGNVGDYQDNWVGRLSHLYEHTTVSKAEAWKLVEWMIGELPWLYLIGGNHDIWSGTGDPLKWIIGQKHIGAFENHGARLALQFPGGAGVPGTRVIRVNARHDFKGHSQWNATHALNKAAKIGFDDHILICGHRHHTGQSIEKNPSSGLISHLVRVASYKMIDDYAMKGGFLDANISPVAATIIDPVYADDDPRLIQVFHDLETAADFLAWKRSR